MSTDKINKSKRLSLINTVAMDEIGECASASVLKVFVYCAGKGYDMDQIIDKMAAEAEIELEI